MADLAVSSLERAIDLFDQWDEDRAWTVVTRHRAMEEEFQSALGRLMVHAAEDSRTAGGAISMVLVIKSLERIGHHAHSLAEYALFNAKGEDVRGSTL
jgi:phosphate transport system protein